MQSHRLFHRDALALTGLPFTFEERGEELHFLTHLAKRHLVRKPSDRFRGSLLIAHTPTVTSGNCLASAGLSQNRSASLIRIEWGKLIHPF